MRSRSFLILVGLVTALAIGLLALGCSDDETPITTTPPETGNELEEALDMVAEQVKIYLDSTTVAIGSGLEVARFFDSQTDIGDAFMGSIQPDSTRQTDWIVSWATDLQSGLGTLNITDSLTYVVDGALSVSARDADQMYVKHYYTWNPVDTTVTSDRLAHTVDLHFAGIDGTTATVNGTFNTEMVQKYVSNDSTVWNEYVLEGNLSDLQFERTGDEWTSGCPNSGTCYIDVEYTHQVDQDLPTSTLWEFTVTFIDGDMNVDVSIGSLSAQYQDNLCTP